MSSNQVTLDAAARAQQMYINTRLVALETAIKLMNTPNYSAVSYVNDPNDPGSDSKPVFMGGKVDHITLLAMAGDIEKYVLGNLEEEAKQAIENARKPKPTIVPVAEVPKGLRP